MEVVRQHMSEKDGRRNSFRGSYFEGSISIEFGMFHGIWQVLDFGIYKAERISHAKRMEVEILNLIHHAHYSMEQSLKHKANRQTAHISP